MRRAFAAGILGGLSAVVAIVTLMAASTAWGDFIAIPRGASSGDTGRMRWRELAANGINSVDFKAPDSLSATTPYTLPTGYPSTTGDVLSSTTAGVLSWTTPASGGSGFGQDDFTTPSDTGFSWVDQGNATIDTSNNKLTLSTWTAPSTSVAKRVKSAPSTPYTVTAAMLLTGRSSSSGQVSGGLLFRQSSDGKWESNFFFPAFSNNSSPLVLDGQRIHQNTGAWFLTQVTTNYNAFGPVIWLRIADDGSVRTHWCSSDGFNWSLVYSVTRTTFLTADQIGFGLNADFNDSSVLSHLVILSWEEQ